MRKITKGNPIASFSEFHEKNPAANWESFHKDARDCYLESRMQILLEEQNCLCGYTEICISEITDSHLDHYIKKSIKPELTFEWTNLIAATLDTDFGANHKDSVYKIKEDDYALIFNPITDNVESYFYYNQRGEVEPISTLDDHLKKKVEKTVEVFNLNHPSLRNRRETLIKQIKSCVGFSEDEINNAFTNSGFVSLIQQEAIVT